MPPSLTAFARELTKVAVAPLVKNIVKNSLVGMGIEALLNRDATPVGVVREGVGWGVGDELFTSAARGLGMKGLGVFAAGLAGGHLASSGLRKQFGDKPVRHALEKLPDDEKFKQIKEAGAIRNIARGIMDGITSPLAMPKSALTEARLNNYMIRYLRRTKSLDRWDQDLLTRAIRDRQEAYGVALGAVANPVGIAALSYGLGKHNQEKTAAALKSILTPQSSNVAGYSYDPKTLDLSVTFKAGGTYTYRGVKANAVKALRRNKSVGKAINKIKAKHEYEKTAFIKTELKPHQQRVVERISQPDQPGLVVAHGLGSGKTLSSIAAQESMNMDADIIVPAALQDNYAKEVKRHTLGESPARAIRSMQGLAGKGVPTDRPMLIVDEAHRARESSSKTYSVLAKNKAQKRLILTASPFYNRPSDIAPLIALAAGIKVLPTDPAEFKTRYIRERLVKPGILGRLRGVKPGTVTELNPKKEKELREVFAKWVDYYKAGKDDYPSVKREDVKVDMAPEQLAAYDTVMSKAPKWVAYKIKKGLPPSKSESKDLNAFLTGTRQISNSTAPFSTSSASHEPKIQKAFENLKSNFDANPNSKAVVYSNYIDSGINPYKKRLDEAKIPYGEYTGGMPKAKRDELVRQYNANKIRALLISSAGGEGLDLKGTRLMQILDPHWNEEKIKQVEGRGIRYKSHADLPEADRNVLVQRYLATRPRRGVMQRLHLQKKDGSVDEYLAQLGSEKEQLIEQFRKLLPHAPETKVATVLNLQRSQP